MAKKKPKNKESTIENYYDLKTKDIDELVAALKGDTENLSSEPVTTNIAEITGEEQTAKPGSKKAEFDPYKIDKFSRIPAWIKALFIKFWFAGAVCFFVNMGLGTIISSALDLLVLDGIVLGIMTDLLVNPIFRFLESSDKEYNNFIMFPFPVKHFWTFFTNIIYYVIVLLGVDGIYVLMDGVWHMNVYVEPLLFGLFAVIIDMAFIGIKDLIVYLIKKCKNKKTNGECDV
ncbi:MAG: hypothetical protein ACI4L9_00540 [Candidatus Coproplasma sp.]